MGRKKPKAAPIPAPVPAGLFPPVAMTSEQKDGAIRAFVRAIVEAVEACGPEDPWRLLGCDVEDAWESSADFNRSASDAAALIRDINEALGVAIPEPKPDPAPNPADTTPAPTNDGGTFPVQGPYSFGSDGARFGAGRTGHTHEGQDVLATTGIPIVAPLAGTVRYTKYQKNGAGYYVVMDAVDGRSFFFAHCRKDTVVV